MASQGSTCQFSTEVFPAELEEIRRRRQILGLAGPAAGRAPSVGHGLVGLALSGGGIRSASLSLGVLEVLARRGALARVDYLSTVSGGGLIGSCVSSLLNSPDTSPEPERFPLGFDPGKAERPAVRYLRNHSRYLAPGGLLDQLCLPAIVLRGILDNVALLVPILIIAVQLTEILYVGVYRWGGGLVTAIPALSVGLFVVAVLAQSVLYRLFPDRFNVGRRDRYEHFLAASLLAVLVVLLFLTPVFLLVQRAIDLQWREAAEFWAKRRSPPWVALGLVLLLLGLAAKASQNLARTMHRVFLLLVGLLGYAAVFALYLLLVLYQVESPLLDPKLLADLARGTVSEQLRSAFRAKGIDLGPAARIEPGGALGVESWVIADGGARYFVTRSGGKLRLVNTLLWDGPGEWVFIGIGVAGLLYGVLFSNPNVTSPHGFFRDRLAEAFVFSEDAKGEVRRSDAPRLSKLNREGSAAPYHLLNATLNLQGETHCELGGRKADFFVFSRHHVGGPTTGYCRTGALEPYDRHLDLGTAMAISGAGLAPNMGTLTIKSLVFVISLLNLRLDYWLPNPRWVRGASRYGRLRLRGSVGPSFLLKEALGRLDARGPYVNLSDGGHLENLGIYELLRRRCKWIIAVDADEDPEMTFGCLMDLIRYARIDLGIEIGIDLDALRPGSNGLCAEHWTAGRIDYGGGEEGHLIYVKASMTGDEPETVREYRSRFPAFPQQSSANQFFTEDQFEAYRALGEHIAGGLVAAGFPWEAPARAARTGQVSAL